MAKPILCLVGRHHWSAVQGDMAGTYHECERCSKRKPLSKGGQAPPNWHAAGGGPS
jgi:hypothetical protein